MLDKKDLSARSTAGIRYILLLSWLPMQIDNKKTKKTVIALKTTGCFYSSIVTRYSNLPEVFGMRRESSWQRQ